MPKKRENAPFPIRRLVQFLRRYQGRRSIREMAREFGVSHAYMHAVLRGHQNPGPAILDFMGVEELRLYRWKQPNKEKDND